VFERTVKDNQSAISMKEEMEVIELDLLNNIESLSRFNHASVKSKYATYQKNYETLVGEVIVA